jgi:membrane protein YdbS with pleckstrin-like domain
MFVVPTAVGLKIGTDLPSSVAVGGVVVMASLLVVQALVWPALAWQYLGYGVREHDLLLQKGVLFRRRTSVPLNRIQHVDTHQGPLERFFGVSSLLVYTASSMSADAVVPGLDEATAESLRDELARRGGDDGV